MIIVVFANSEGIDTCIIPESALLDLELGDETGNDFELIIPYSDFTDELFEVGGYVYIPGTEYGGKVLEITEDTESEEIMLSGISFRGMLASRIAKPPPGEDYLVLNGEIGTCLNNLLDGAFGDFMYVTEDSADVPVSGYKVARYTDLLSACNKLASRHQCNFVIMADGSGEKLHVALSAVPASDYSEETEASQDGTLSFRISDGLPAVTHLICAGPGELKDRMIIFLDWNSGSPVVVPAIPSGSDVRECLYDYPNAESADDLIENGIEKFIELNKTASQTVKSAEVEDVYEIGDVVAGRSYVTGIQVVSHISQKVVKYESGKLSVTYKVGE